MPHLLHIGCGPKTKAQTTAAFNTPDWQEPASTSTRRLSFTERVLIGVLQAAGFASIASRRRAAPYFDLWAVASKQALEEGALRALAVGHIPD